MFKLGADVNDLDDENRTPLHLAVQYNRYNFAECLIGAGANVTVIRRNGTPLKPNYSLII